MQLVSREGEDIPASLDSWGLQELRRHQLVWRSWGHAPTSSGEAWQRSRTSITDGGVLSAQGRGQQDASQDDYGGQCRSFGEERRASVGAGLNRRAVPAKPSGRRRRSFTAEAGNCGVWRVLLVPP